MKKLFTFFILLQCVLLGKSQVTLLSENFDEPIAPVLPYGWSSTLIEEIGFRTDSSNFSDYTNASGFKNALIRNSDSSGVYSLYSPVFSTVNKVNVSLLFASRVSNNFLTPGSTTPILEVSTNGGSDWNIIAYTDNDGNSTWNLVNGGVPISLPADAYDNPYVQLRWSVQIVNDPSGTYRMDDIVVTADENPVVNLTVRVNMNDQVVASDGVYVSGEFNGWNYGANAMEDIGGGIFQYIIEVNPNTDVKFRFYNGSSGNSEIVPSDCGVDDGLGSGSLCRSSNIGSENAVFGPVCFNECADCIIVEPVLINITFQVDMSQQTVSTNGVHLLGNFQGNDPSSMEMLDAGSGIYQYTAVIEEGTQVLYKFVNGNTLTDVESVPSDCGTNDGSGDYFRFVYAGGVDLTTDLVCYQECGVCAYHSITFQVDMSQQTISANGVHIVGNFQGNDPSSTAMTSVGNGVFQYSASYAPGTQISYRFVNGNQMTDAEIVPANCGLNDGTGDYFRNISVGVSDQIVSVVCYGACAPCIVNGIENISEVETTFYPNPTTGSVNLMCRRNEVYQLMVYNSYGQLLFSKSKISHGSVLDLSDFGSGIYTLILVGEGEQKTHRLIVE